MVSWLKRVLYFPVASYFRFFARIRLNKWKPRVIVVTGSNGKTTLLHMLEAQIGDKARYSHHANSSFGIPFDILGLKRKTLFKSEWIGLLFSVPFKIFSTLPREKIYIVEADCDRPKEGKFLAEFLKPEVVLWISTSKTHSMNFDKLVDQKKFENVEEAIAYEFGYYLEYCSKLTIFNGDSSLELQQRNRTKAEIKLVEKEKNLKKYLVSKDGTEFVIDNQRYIFPHLLPEESFYAIKMCRLTVDYLQSTFDPSFKKFVMPAGRGSVFEGIKNITLIDSCYNANLSSMKAILDMFEKFPQKNKWIVLGDMLEQGKSEKEEHEKLAELVVKYKFENVILMGLRVCKYTYPKLENKLKTEKFLGPKEVLDYLLSNIKGGETILFKGARFMEGIIEHLLLDKKDVDKLARREEVWEIRRKKWGL